MSSSVVGSLLVVVPAGVGLRAVIVLLAVVVLLGQHVGVPRVDLHVDHAAIRAGDLDAVDDVAVLVLEMSAARDTADRLAESPLPGPLGASRRIGRLLV